MELDCPDSNLGASLLGAPSPHRLVGSGSACALHLEDACLLAGLVAHCPCGGSSALAFVSPPDPPHTGQELFSLVSFVLLLLPKIKANGEHYKGFILLHQRSLALNSH